MNRTIRDFLAKLKPVRKRIQSAWLFGSRARGDHRPDSDYDLLIVVDERDKKLLNVIYGAVTEVQLNDLVYVSAKVFPRKLYTALRTRKTPFITNVLKEGVRIV